MSLEMANLFRRVTLGVYVIGVAAENQCNAFTAAWVMPVSFDPLLLALSINPRHRSYALLGQGGGFSVNVLRSDQINLAEHFGRPGIANKLEAIAWRKGNTGAPLLEDAVAWFECAPTQAYPAGDHVLVIGRVVAGRLVQPAAQPLRYADLGDMDGASAIFPDRF